MSHLYSLTTFVLSNMIIFEYHYISIINSHQSNCAGSLPVPLHHGICWNLCCKKTQFKPCFNLAPFLWKICNKITVMNFPNLVTLTSYNAVCGKPLKYDTYKKPENKTQIRYGSPISSYVKTLLHKNKLTQMQTTTKNNPQPCESFTHSWREDKCLYSANFYFWVAPLVVMM